MKEALVAATAAVAIGLGSVMVFLVAIYFARDIDMMGHCKNRDYKFDTEREIDCNEYKPSYMK